MCLFGVGASTQSDNAGEVNNYRSGQDDAQQPTASRERKPRLPKGRPLGSAFGCFRGRRPSQGSTSLPLQTALPSSSSSSPVRLLPPRRSAQPALISCLLHQPLPVDAASRSLSFHGVPGATLLVSRLPHPFLVPCLL